MEIVLRFYIEYHLPLFSSVPAGSESTRMGKEVEEEWPKGTEQIRDRV